MYNRRPIWDTLVAIGLRTRDNYPLAAIQVIGSAIGLICGLHALAAYPPSTSSMFIFVMDMILSVAIFIILHAIAEGMGAQKENWRWIYLWLATTAITSLTLTSDSSPVATGFLLVAFAAMTQWFFIVQGWIPSSYGRKRHRG
ncbi:hypothetical protein EPO04_00290 [Patescibacteria group bacterium]|nr:MAG: hypothetical protein EPO04_00290 [Patescibacteria group bacterium]